MSDQSGLGLSHKEIRKRLDHLLALGINEGQVLPQEGLTEGDLFVSLDSMVKRERFGHSPDDCSDAALEQGRGAASSELLWEGGPLDG